MTNTPLFTIIKSVIDSRILKKLVMSRNKDKKILKAYAEFISSSSGDEILLQVETQFSNGKVFHKTLDTENAPLILTDEILSDYRQADIITANGSCSVLISSGGNVHIKNNIKSIPLKESDTMTEKAGSYENIRTHNAEKNYILSNGDETALPFLKMLGICDSNGRIHDKRQAKFRQINKFLENVALVSEHFPKSGTINIMDLCCGKSYLTFAVYWFIKYKLGREVLMTGADLKEEVISYCSSCAEKLGWDGLCFVCCDIKNFIPENPPDLTLSLHACDTATDIVLYCAIKNNSKIILSTPCCHRQIYSEISSPDLNFITRHTILKNKLCDAATDAMRASLLELANYDVTVTELIDPDETPKNVLIRAFKKDKPLGEKKISELKKQYEASCELLGVKPYLNTLLG